MVLSGQIGSAWEWYHWIDFKKVINLYIFFVLNIFFKDLFGSWFLCAQTTIFSQKCERVNNCFFGLRLVSRIFEEFQHPATQTKIVLQHFGGFFIQYCKSAPANWKKGFYTNRDPNKQEVGFILYEAAQNLEVFLNIQVKLKKSKSSWSFSRPIQWYHFHADPIQCCLPPMHKK